MQPVVQHWRFANNIDLTSPRHDSRLGLYGPDEGPGLMDNGLRDAQVVVLIVEEWGALPLVVVVLV